MKLVHSGAIPPKRQTNSMLDQVAPVQNTWYTVLDTTINVRLINLAINIQTTDEDLEVRLTYDNVTPEVCAYPAGAGAGTNLFIHPSVSANSATIQHAITTSFQYGRPYIGEYRSLKVEVRKTSANGAGNLRAGCVWAQW